jgi:hypothetical protein
MNKRKMKNRANEPEGAPEQFGILYQPTSPLCSHA